MHIEDPDLTQLFEESRGFVLAPAGCGKTELIARAVAYKLDDKRQLILTHTHAGVHSLRERLKRKKVPANRYHLNTIAGWALDLVTSYPRLSGLTTFTPVESEDWLSVYRAASRFLDWEVAKTIIRATYSAVYIDEYQDCSVRHHEIAVKLADLVPCRVLGDPVQAIFDFSDDDPLVEWSVVENDLGRSLLTLGTPFRWKSTRPELGDWLYEVRLCMDRKEPIDLTNRPQCVAWRPLSNSIQKNGEEKRRILHDWHNELDRRGRQDETIVVVFCQPQVPYLAHDLAKQLSGVYTSMEEMSCSTLLQFCEVVERKAGSARAVEIIEFAAKCRTKVSDKVGRSGKSPFHRGTVANLDKVYKTASPDIRAVIQALNMVSENDDLNLLLPTMEQIERLSDGIIFRRELWREMKRALWEFASGTYDTLRDAAWYSRERTRKIGRFIDKRTISRTVLIKGLEFEHVVVVLDRDEQPEAKNLYVAMTRASKSLTILSRNEIIYPDYSKMR